MLLSIFLYLMITYNVITDIFLVRRVKYEGYQPMKPDYVLVCLTGFIGLWYFSLAPLTMEKNVVEGIANAVLGAACLGVTCWALTTFNLVKKGF